VVVGGIDPVDPLDPPELPELLDPSLPDEPDELVAPVELELELDELDELLTLVAPEDVPPVEPVLLDEPELQPTIANVPTTNSALV
jgi:hypothetical protein